MPASPRRAGEKPRQKEYPAPMPEENFPAKPKRLFTRRTVLTGIGGVVGAGALGVGGFLLVDKYDRFGRSADRTIRDHRVNLRPLGRAW